MTQPRGSAIAVLLRSPNPYLDRPLAACSTGDMARKSRQKGVVYERKIAQRLRDSGLFPQCGRNWSEQNERRCGRDLNMTPGVCIQLKHGATAPWRKALEEAQEEVKRCSSDELPVAITRNNNDDDVVHMLLEDWIKLMMHVQIVAWEFRP